jgi:phospholipase/carboxylesterase
MTASQLEFVHRFVPATRSGATPLLLLHGTGGDENDLLALGQELAPGSPLLSPRGQVLENGMPRFFRRLAEGIFDQDDLRLRARELARFVADARSVYGLGGAAPIALGFSNGANMAAALLLLHPGTLGGALLFRPMVPLVPDPLPSLRDVPVLIAGGRQDTIARPEQTQGLADMFNQAGADVTLHWSRAGHGLTREDMEAGKQWMSVVSAGIR